MTTIVTTDVVTSTVIEAAAMNNNFTAVKTVVNGNIDNANIVSTAAIAVAKLGSGTPSAGKYLDGAGTWTALPAASGPTITYATTPPGSPATGDIWYCVDSTTVPTFQWTFRWNGSSSNADKWEFVGGAPYQISGAPNAVLNTGTQVAATSAYWFTGMSFTTPRAGVWTVEGSAEIDPVASVSTFGIGVFSDVTRDIDNSFRNMRPSAVNEQHSPVTSGRTASLATAKLIGIAASGSSANHKVIRTNILITPVRVS